MEDDGELRGIAEIRARLEDGNSDLRVAIVRDLGTFTVALLCVSQLEGRDVLELAGTGTLVQFRDFGGILTAAHVWRKKLREVQRFGITLKEAVEHKYLIDTKVVTPFITDPPWAEEWGPDMAFLQLPADIVRDILAIGLVNLYNLARKRSAGFNGLAVDIRVLMGTPKSLGTFTDASAELQIIGMFQAPDSGVFSPLAAPNAVRGEYDYIDLENDLTLPGVPQNFGGVSGGGLWRVLVYKSAQTGEILWVKELEGVAFYQSPIVNNHRVIRCHGPQSIGTALRLLV